jgi:hypothetical protein
MCSTTALCCAVQGVEDSTGPDMLVELYNKQTRRMQTAQERLGANAGEQ